MEGLKESRFLFHYPPLSDLLLVLPLPSTPGSCREGEPIDAVPRVSLMHPTCCNREENDSVCLEKQEEHPQPMRKESFCVVAASLFSRLPYRGNDRKEPQPGKLKSSGTTSLCIS